MAKIIIDESLYVGKGAERKCYRDPNDDEKIIKVLYNDSIGRSQNKLDNYYYKYLKNKEVSFSNIPKFYGFIETDKGLATVFDAIKDYNHVFSRSFEAVIIDENISSEVELELLTELKLYLSENLIVFGDVVLSNILCQEIAKNRYKLIIVDGLGARRFGFKLWLHIHSKIFTRYRINRQWKKLMQNYNILKIKQAKLLV